VMTTLGGLMRNLGVGGLGIKDLLTYAMEM